MGAYFSEDWFYEKFSLPDCDIRVHDREIMVDVEFPTTEDDRKAIPEPLETLTLCCLVEMPKIIPSAFFSEFDENTEPLDEAADAAALAALRKIIKERYGCGLATYWHSETDKDEPSYRPLTSAERQQVREFMDSWFPGVRCKNAQDAIYTIEEICKTLVSEIDEGEYYNPLLADHLICFTELRREILRDGLPTITDENMFYDILVTRESISIELRHIRLIYTLNKLLGLFDKDGKNSKPSIFPYSKTLYSVPFPVLTCAEYANRCGVDQGTVRQWIRRGKLRSAFKTGRDWMIPVTATPPARGFVPGRYHVNSTIPKEAIREYPFLSKMFSNGTLVVDKAGSGKFNIIHDLHKEQKILATLTQAEREKFEFMLIESDWCKYDLETKVLKTKICPINTQEADRND